MVTLKVIRWIKENDSTDLDSEEQQFNFLVVSEVWGVHGNAGSEEIDWNYCSLVEISDSSGLFSVIEGRLQVESRPEPENGNDPHECHRQRLRT
jgi:hypothetical protein